jgi:hypothetical protein
MLEYGLQIMAISGTSWSGKMAFQSQSEVSRESLNWHHRTPWDITCLQAHIGSKTQQLSWDMTWLIVGLLA